MNWLAQMATPPLISSAAFKLLTALKSTQVLHKIGATKPIEEMLKAAGVEYTMFDKVEPNPTIHQVSLLSAVLDV